MRDAKRGRNRYPGAIEDFITWDCSYEANAVPDSSLPVWTRVNSGGGITVNCAGGLLTISHTVSGGSDYKNTLYYREDGAVISSKKKVIQFRGVVTNVNGHWVCIGDGTRGFNLYFTQNGTIYNEATSIATGLTLTDYFTAHIEFDNINGLKVYINGTLAATRAYTSCATGTYNLVLFGARTDVNVGSAGTRNVGATFDWLRYKLDAA